MNKLEGKIALITGGNSGIGLASAKRLIDEGARVIITGRNPKTLESARSELGKGLLSAIASDSGRIADITRLVEEVRKHTSHLDFVFVNAGIGAMGSLADATEASFDETFNVNLKGPFFLVQKLLPFLREGSSVLFNSTALTLAPKPGIGVYTASKSALTMFMHMWAMELAPRKIRVNSIHPGPIETAILSRSGLPKDALDSMKKGIESATAMGRFGNSEEVAAMVAFLASNEASYMTGSQVVVDGGFSGAI